MAICLEDYRCKLITKIAASDSEQQVKRYLDAAIKGLQSHRVNGHITLRFLARVEHELNQYRPEDVSALRWKIIEAGKTYCMALTRTLQKS